MVKPIVLNNLGKGLNLYDPASEIQPGQMVGGANLLFSRGLTKTPFGFAKLGEEDLPLDSGRPILALYQYREQSANPTDHLIAATTQKLYRRDAVSDGWNDISPSSALRSSADSIPSFAAIPHKDGIAADGDGDKQYYHVLYCDGGNSPIYRWAGKFEDNFAELAGADGYHETDVDPATPTAHYARQVTVFYNHVILLSPKTWDATSDVFTENPQTVLWGKAGLLEGEDAYAIAETGAGEVPLVDTGDENVWCQLIGDALAVYQKHSIWVIYHVGGGDIFRAQALIPNIGLLSPSLILPYRNQHFLLGSDYAIYAYFGGTSYQAVGDKTIRDALAADMDPGKINRCRMCMGSNGSRLWLFIVRNGYDFATRAYGVDLRTGAWMMRDYEHKWPSGGITAATLAGTSIEQSGRTWQEDIDTGQTYTEAISAGTTWEQLTRTVLVQETMALGDNSGYAYQYDEDLTTDDSVEIPASGITQIFDFGRPDVAKWWGPLSIEATGTALQVFYRIEYFETTDDGWIAMERTLLTDDYETYEFGLEDVCSTHIQFKIANFHGSDLAARKLVLAPPTALG